MVRDCLTWMEKGVGKLEDKEGLTPSDLHVRKIKHQKKLAKEHDREFEQKRIEVLDIIKAEDTAVWIHKNPSSMYT